MTKFDDEWLDQLESDWDACQKGICTKCSRYGKGVCYKIHQEILDALRYLRKAGTIGINVCENVNICTEKCDSADELSKNAQNYTKEKSCLDCAFCALNTWEYPCCECERAVSPLSIKYGFRSDMWAPKVLPTPPETMNLKPSMVEHPAHYNREGAMECIDEMVLLFGIEEAMVFCKLSAWKYRYRAGDKGDAQTDKKKSDNFLKMYKELKERLDNDQY